MVRLAANLSFFFKERPFLDRFAAARSAGFRAVEFMFAGDGGYTSDAAAVRARLNENGLEQVLLNAPAGDWEGGERGLGGLPLRDDEWRSSVEYGLQFASDVGAPRMHVMAGLLSGGADEDTLVPRLQWAVGPAADAGVCLCIEPLNPIDFPGYLVPDVKTALRVIERVDSPKHCKLQLDLYHYAMGEANGSSTTILERAIRELLPHAEHVQIANPPGRNEPGVGVVDYPPLLALLDELGYSGFVGCEYKPSTATTNESLSWARPYGIEV